MVGNYQRKTNRVVPPADTMIEAASAVKNTENPVSIRKAGRDLNVHCEPLERYCRKVSDEELAVGSSQVRLGYKKARRVFDEQKNLM
ncbi:hypothetical protein ILUMI_17061 [Ignelater luminosus]|uniref:Uncharacterized protein n=1 Tax=Ignelater luminosus TaxID=2038154 RepID=A0A8K0CPT2_IGNLU|nr:hypothetical protein ILUMI_17061 [Ignelater luminosus]